MTFAFNEDAGVILAADLGATHARLAVTNLAGTVLAEETRRARDRPGPGDGARLDRRALPRAAGEVGRGDADVRGIGIGVPGPVEHATGRPRNPPIMPGWDGYPIPERFADRYQVPVLVDNDVNIMALGEHWTHWREVDHLLLVKVGTGIGCGIIVDGRIHRGADGAAGDIGHIRVAAATRPRRRPAAAATSAVSRRWPAAGRWPPRLRAAGPRRPALARGRRARPRRRGAGGARWCATRAG